MNKHIDRECVICLCPQSFWYLELSICTITTNTIMWQSYRILPIKIVAILHKNSFSVVKRLRSRLA